MSDRIESLEIHCMRQEKALESMSLEMYAQQKQMMQLLQKITLLEERLKVLQLSPVASESEETPPPHY